MMGGQHNDRARQKEGGGDRLLCLPCTVRLEEQQKSSARKQLENCNARHPELIFTRRKQGVFFGCRHVRAMLTCRTHTFLLMLHFSVQTTSITSHHNQYSERSRHHLCSHNQNKLILITNTHIMRTSAIFALAFAAPAAAFSGSSFTGASMKTAQNSASITMEYIPR